MYTVKARVVVSDPRSFQGGTSDLGGKKGTVVKARERSCDVLLDGETEILWFSNKELAPLED